MRKFLILLAVPLCFALAVSAQDIDKMPIVTVTGTAEVMVVPDEVVFSLDVRKMNMDLQAAKRESDATIAKVLELTRRFSIAPQNVKTDSISVDRVFEVVRGNTSRIITTSDEDDDDLAGKRTFKGYRISTTVVVKLTDLTRFEEFFAESLKTGITEVDNVIFQTSKLRENKDKARDLAMKAAREKASALAGAVGQGIGKAIKITEGSTASRYNGANVSNNYMLAAGATTTSNVATFAPGSIKIDAEVTVSFLLN
jgi:uncharacterized protein YggE